MSKSKNQNIAGSPKILFDKGRSRIFFIGGRESKISKIENITAANTIIAVSLKNWNRNWLLPLPKTFLIPTSFERFKACAVERLIKFTQAIIKIKAAMTINAFI